jgi:peptidoglycan/LPS O-acetylase OafA/YrhL
VLLLLTVLVLGPLASDWSTAAYLGAPQTWEYLLCNLAYAHRWFLPGVFEDLPYTGVVNGSLWSLRVEVLAYLGLALAGIVGLLRTGWAYVPAAVLALLALHLWVPVLGTGDYLWPLTMFGLGSMAWVQRQRLPLGTVVLLTLVVACWATAGSAAFRLLLALTLAYGCLWAAYVPRLLWGYNRFGDYSYGLYLYAFPIQQGMVGLWQLSSVWSQFVLAALITLAFAIGSWHGIEKPCLDAFRRRRNRGRQPPDAGDQPSASKDMPTVE